MRKAKTLSAAAVIAVCLWSIVPVAAQRLRYYTVNGQVAPDNVQVYLAQQGLPPGNYWLDYATGYWGRVGDPQPWGNLRSSNDAPNAGNRRGKDNYWFNGTGRGNDDGKTGYVCTGGSCVIYDH